MYSINSKGTAGNGRSLLKRFMGLFRNDSYDKLKTVINRLEEAKTKDSYYGSILNFIPNLVCAKDKRGVYTMVNQTFADFAGLDVSEIIGKTDKELNIYLNAEQVMEADRKMFDTKQKQFTPLEPFTNNYGELYWFQTVKTPVINHEGVVEEIVVTSVDVTKKVLEEQRLSKSELRYRSIFENNYSGIIAIDKELIIVNKNKAFDSLLGLKHVVGVQGDLKRYLQDEDRREHSAWMAGRKTV